MIVLSLLLRLLGGIPQMDNNEGCRIVAVVVKPKEA